ncbi:MAG TPA: DUF3313 family protein [Rhizomicrobium sp.]|nr:DUF3313 family protein [Rhizomicrobium sp.]
MTRSRIAILAQAFWVALLICGNGFAQQAPQTLSNGLQRVQGSRVALAYVRPGTDWTKYRNIMIEPLIVPASARNAAPSGATPEFGESYLLSDSDVSSLQGAYAKSMHDVLTNAGYSIVTTVQPNTLIVAAEISRIILNAPVENSRPGYGGMSMTLSQGGGSMTMKAALADATSRIVLAEAADVKYGSNMWGINNEVANLGQARFAFDQWATDLKKRLQTP